MYCSVTKERKGNSPFCHQELEIKSTILCAEIENNKHYPVRKREMYSALSINWKVLNVLFSQQELEMQCNVLSAKYGNEMCC